jgi:hypothetical protein
MRTSLGMQRITIIIPALLLTAWPAMAQVTISSSTSLTATQTSLYAGQDVPVTGRGKMRLVFEEPPSSLGTFWGLRWAGPGHAGQPQGLVGSGELSWDDSAVGGGVVIFTNATHTMVGYVLEQAGSIFRFR